MTCMDVILGTRNPTGRDPSGRVAGHGSCGADGAGRGTALRRRTYGAQRRLLDVMITSFYR